MTVTEPIRFKHEIYELADYYLRRGEMRNYVLVVLGVHTALRISDILRLTWDSIYDFEHKVIRKTIALTEQKTGKQTIIALNANIIDALKKYTAAAMPGMPIFVNKRTGRAISRIQAYRIIRAAAEELRLTNKVSCHSLRKTFGYHAWKSGVSPAVIMGIYNHSSLAVTRHYLGITQDDKNAVYLGLNLLN